MSGATTTRTRHEAVLDELVASLEERTRHTMICPTCDGRGATCHCCVKYCGRPEHACTTCPGGGEIPVRQWAELKLAEPA